MKWVSVLGVGLVLLAAVSRQDSILEKKIQGLIAQLGDTTLAKRNEAQKELELIPEAEAPLKEYVGRTKGKNPEIETRARDLLHRFDVMRNGRIVYRLKEELWVVDYEGCHARQITRRKDHGRPVGYPVWSPDGRKAAFVCEEKGNNEDIYVVEVESGKLTRLTFHPSGDREPCWSPDGKKIIFESERDENTRTIYSADADGKNMTRLTGTEYGSAYPRWSPDGTKIAFRSDREEGWEIFVMDADGKNPVRLTHGEGTAGDITWSPDGKRMAYSLDRSRMRTDGQGLVYVPHIDVCVVDADGANPIRLTNDPKYRKESVTWSPDGTMLVFDSDSNGGKTRICLSDAGGKETRPLLWSDDIGYSSPQFCPDGKKIMFLEHAHRGLASICVAGIDGKDMKRLVTDDVFNPVWSPPPRPPEK